MGQSISTDSRKITPYNPVTNVCYLEDNSQWKNIENLAKSCTAKITFNQFHLGCGVLVGIDRVLVPAHVISTTSNNLKVSFSVEDKRYCYYPQSDVLNIHPISEQFVVLQIRSDTFKSYPGGIIEIPKIANERYEGPFLFSNYSGESPSTQISEGTFCFEPGRSIQFCSIIETEEGDCGGGYFDARGYLFGIHFSRSSGMCTLNAETRQAIFSTDILKGSLKAQQLFSMNVCIPMQHQAYLPVTYNHAEIDICFIEEGRKRNPIKILKNGVTYYAHHDGHGDKHYLPQDKKFDNAKKNNLINRTKKGPALFYPNVIHAKNYDECVQRCVETWLNKAEDPDIYNMTVESERPVGADQGKETKIIQIYHSEVGAHIRPLFV